jgi:hypothetical protein
VRAERLPSRDGQTGRELPAVTDSRVALIASSEDEAHAVCFGCLDGETIIVYRAELGRLYAEYRQLYERDPDAPEMDRLEDEITKPRTC